MARLTLKEVSRALDALPDDQRIAIAMVAIEGVSYADAAEMLDVPVGTVLSRVSRARKSLSINLVTILW